MQKITALLEQYVEWVALAIGGLFLLMMVFLYVLQTPVSDKVGERPVTLRDVDNEIYTQVTSRLEAEMANPKVPSAEVKAYSADFTARMAMKNVELPAVASGVWIASGMPSRPLVDGGKAAPETPSASAIAAVLPEPPIAQWYGFSAGRSTVLTDPNAAPPAQVFRPRTARAPAAAAAAPTASGPPGGGMAAAQAAAQAAAAQAAAAASAAGAAAAAAAQQAAMGGGRPAAPAAGGRGGAESPAALAASVEGVDKVWVSAAWEIKSDELARAFTEANVPTSLQTAMLRIEAVREELQDNGAWGNATVVKPMAYHSVPEMPQAGAGSSAERSYLDWVTTNVQTLVVPSFYPRSAGDDWYVPGQPNPNEPVKTVAPPVRQPTRTRGMQGGYPGGPPGGYPGAGGTGGTRRNTRGGRTGGQFGPPGYAAEDAARPAQSGYPISYQFGPPPEVMAEIQRQAQAAAAQSAQAAQRSAMGGMGGPAAGMGRTGGVGSVADSFPEGYTVPSGTFAPGELTENLLVWVHDDTVTPGKTYRYKMRYSIQNPFYGQVSLVKNPDVAKKFALISKDSDWSDDIEAPAILRFFVASGIAANATSARFDVFRWQKGEWHHKTFAVDPGEMIGMKEKDPAADFTTGFYLVDVNPNPISREPVTLCDAGGRLQGRNYQDDLSGSTSFKKQIDWVDPNAAPPAAAVGANPYGGGPPPGFVPPVGPFGPGGPTGGRR